MNAIEFENVSKQYRLGLVGTGTLAHDIRRFWITNVLRQEDPYLKIGETNDRTSKGNSDYVWALRDITFNVEQGDVVGIIGKNGAGKSTLLKLLSRVTGPTTGTIRAHGRIGSLLEVGTGFHPEMTGRENIFMNGAILGMTRREIQSKLDEIVDFSGCERYIDTPVKRYSSGMMVRLGFAVAAHLDPEILVVDEVLAVGDAEFQKKAIGKMQDVSKGEGRTVLFVSHNMASVKSLCKHGVLLENGMVRNVGEIGDIVDEYLGLDTVSDTVVDLLSVKHESECLGVNVCMSKFEVNMDSTALQTGHKLHAVITIKSGASYRNLKLRIGVRDRETIPVSMSMADKEFELKPGENRIPIELNTSFLAPGFYSLTLVLLMRGNELLDVVRNAYSFEIIPKKGFNDGRAWEHIFYGNVSGFDLKILDESI